MSQDVEEKLKRIGLGDVPNESHSSSEEDGSSSDDAHGRASKSRGKPRKKLKSGKTAKITSRIVRPQIWPQSELSLTHVSKEVAYDELSIEEFTAGYCAILKSKHLTEVERSECIDHLYDVMYLTMHYEWAAVRRFHAAVLLEIERGHLQWGDSFTYLERHSFHDQPKWNARQKPTQSSPANPVLFCRDYQREKCHHDNYHFGTIRGNKKWLQHICAKCWITSRTREKHLEFLLPALMGILPKRAPQPRPLAIDYLTPTTPVLAMSGTILVRLQTYTQGFIRFVMNLRLNLRFTTRAMTFMIVTSPFILRNSTIWKLLRLILLKSVIFLLVTYAFMLFSLLLLFPLLSRLVTLWLHLLGAITLV